MSDGRDQLTQVEALALTAAYGVHTARGGLATNEDEASGIAADLGYPVVLKIVSSDIVHKTEIGGVRVGVASETELRAAHREMLARVAAAAPEARVDGVLVQEMVAGGCETIAGVTRDPAFGPLVMFGLGGIFVEALRDVVFRIAPLDDVEAIAMTSAIRGTSLLDGLRGRPRADRGVIASVLRRIGQLAIDVPEIAELDVNPLLATGDRAIALDARVRIALPEMTTGNLRTTPPKNAD
jgi:succinyl-CoA synthetase beta subunit